MKEVLQPNLNEVHSGAQNTEFWKKATNSEKLTHLSRKQSPRRY